MINSFESMVFAHLLQATIVVLCTLVVVRLCYRKYPHLAFLVAMLALAKCLVPPLLTSPTGLFTRLSSLSFVPKLQAYGNFDLPALGKALNNDPALAGNAPYAVAQSSVGLGGILLTLWCIGVVGLAGVSALRLWRVNRVIRTALPAKREFRNATNALRLRLGVRRNVRVLVSNENFGPACVGVFRPTLILPRSMVDIWPKRLLDPVVAHELVHIRRGDVLWGYLQYACQLCLWFHPLVWWLGRRAQLLCERCCDNEVIASLGCQPADYGESLVRVLELRTVCKQLPFSHAMSPVEITTQRLQQLSTTAYSPRSGRLAWVTAILLAALILPGMKWTTRLELELEAMRRHKQQINAALTEGDWELASRLLQPVVVQEPSNPDAIFFLGYSLHQAGRLDEAIEYHKRAAEFSSVKPIAIYNLACALALKGDCDDAMQNLAFAVTTGFCPEGSLRTDPDLRNLFTRPDFRELDAHVNQPGALAKLCDSLIDQVARSTKQNTVIVARTSLTPSTSVRGSVEVMQSVDSQEGSSPRGPHSVRISGSYSAKRDGKVEISIRRTPGAAPTTTGPRPQTFKFYNN